jgi:hypothetical protein
VKCKIEFTPFLGDASENSLHFTRLAYIKWHQDRRFEFLRERLHMYPGFLVQISNRDLSVQSPECGGAAPTDEVLTGNARDEPSLFFQKLRFERRRQALRRGSNSRQHITCQPTRFWLIRRIIWSLEITLIYLKLITVS